MMIYKVLAEIDYRHLQKTGMPITNLEYLAWKWGPVPHVFDKEITDRENDKLVLPDDFTPALSIIEERWRNKKTGENCKSFTYKAKRQPNLNVFSPRQVSILDDVAFIYKTATPSQASEASHEKDTPWRKTVDLQGKENVKIDFFNILPKGTNINVEEAKERLSEISAYRLNFGN